MRRMIVGLFVVWCCWCLTTGESQAQQMNSSYLRGLRYAHASQGRSSLQLNQPVLGHFRLAKSKRSLSLLGKKTLAMTPGPDGSHTDDGMGMLIGSLFIGYLSVTVGALVTSIGNLVAPGSLGWAIAGLATGSLALVVGVILLPSLGQSSSLSVGICGLVSAGLGLSSLILSVLSLMKKKAPRRSRSKMHLLPWFAQGPSGAPRAGVALQGVF